MISRSISLLIISVGILAGCASRSQKPYIPPNTSAAKFKSITFLPFYGVPVDPITQSRLSGLWSDWWKEVYPGATWIKSTEAIDRLTFANLLDEWSAAERDHVRLGNLPVDYIKRVCAAAGTQAILQTSVLSASAGVESSGFFSMNRDAGQPSNARMAMTLYSCSDYRPSWKAADELNYKSGYSHNEMIEYVMGALASKIDQK